MALSIGSVFVVAAPVTQDTPVAFASADVSEGGVVAFTCFKDPLPPACLGAAAIPQGDAACPDAPEGYESVDCILALSGTGSATTCDLLYCNAVSIGGPSIGNKAVSVQGDADGFIAISLLGEATGEVPVSAGGACGSAACVDAQPTDDAEADLLAVSGSGHAQSEAVAVSLGGSSEAGLVAVTVNGPATAPDGVAISGLGHAEGIVAASLLGSTDGTFRLTDRVEMAHDGYLVVIERVGARGFDVRVLGQQELTTIGGQPIGLQYAFDPIDVLGPDGPTFCSAPSDCGMGIFLTTIRQGTPDLSDPCGPLTLPLANCYPDQVLQVRTGADGHTYLHVDLVVPTFTPTFQGGVMARVVVDRAGEEQRVEGFYNVAKFILPLDALDAVADIVRIN